ncbi:hypothetical protein N8090_01585 [Amylibacter sp.]|nr:hypothetical protein [Amylibacter sp.]MDB9852539.1 hypothetical protein [Amylibacter sp.]MDC1283588.1 hypothetical protein [Amylibacter sp.]MDC1489023.1 hypothetical protein [Amylibacter sp.]
MSEWLYQIRIKVSESISDDLRGMQKQNLSISIKKIADLHQMTIVCTYDAFKAYCDEAEQNGINGYGLYHWTKATIDDPLKKLKHLRSFAFYLGEDQIYSNDLAVSIKNHLHKLDDDELLEINLIDSNPENNPQPPKKYQMKN